MQFKSLVFVRTSLLFFILKSPTASAQGTKSSAFDDGSLPFHKTTVLASHNSHANRDAANSFFEIFGINQEDSIYHQLSVNGVRALSLDIKLDASNEDPLRLVHGPLDYGGFKGEIEKNLIPFLEEDENAVVSLYLQAVGDTNTGNDAGIRSAMLNRLKEAFNVLAVNGVPLKNLTFKYNHKLWSNHDEWPTMNELRSANQRIFVFSDRSEFTSSGYGFLHNRRVMQENHWDGIDSCVSRYNWKRLKVSLPNNRKWSRLFFMNHFCCGSGAQSHATTVSLFPLIGGGDNGWGTLYNRIKMCMKNNGGVKPNFISLDWVKESKEAINVAKYMNFGGALGTKQLCVRDRHCATSSCNNLLGKCQCKECSQDGCGGCDSGQICVSNGIALNECRSIGSKQDEKSLQEEKSHVATEEHQDTTLTLNSTSQSLESPSSDDSSSIDVPSPLDTIVKPVTPSPSITPSVNAFTRYESTEQLSSEHTGTPASNSSVPLATSRAGLDSSGSGTGDAGTTPLLVENKSSGDRMSFNMVVLCAALYFSLVVH